jgi:hypothetical protein
MDRDHRMRRFPERTEEAEQQVPQCTVAFEWQLPKQRNKRIGVYCQLPSVNLVRPGDVLCQENPQQEGIACQRSPAPDRGLITFLCLVFPQVHRVIMS